MLALVPWGVRGLYEAPAIGHKACPSAMGGEPPRAIQHPAVICLGSLRAPVTVVGEVLGCQLFTYVKTHPVLPRRGNSLGTTVRSCALVIRVPVKSGSPS